MAKIAQYRNVIGKAIIVKRLLHFPRWGVEIKNATKATRIERGESRRRTGGSVLRNCDKVRSRNDGLVMMLCVPKGSAIGHAL